MLMIKPLRILKVLGQTAFLFGLLSWFYGFVIQVTHPEFLTEPMSHLTLWIRVDTFNNFFLCGNSRIFSLEVSPRASIIFFVDTNKYDG